MADYRMTANSTVMRVHDAAAIPDDPANVDRMAYDAWLAAGGVPDAYEPPPEPAPASISDRQFFQHLAIFGIITESEALAAVKTGDIPAALQGFVDAIPDAADRFAANMLLSGATTFERAHPLTAAIGAAQNLSEQDVDDFFRAAAQL